MISLFQAFFEFCKELLKHLKIINSHKAGDVILRTAEIYDAMREVVLNESLGIHRFLVVKAHNGGGDFRNDAMTYATVLHEEIRYPMHSVKTDYQCYPIDGYYNDMLLNIYQHNSMDIRVSKMEADSVLANIYHAEGVKYSKVFFIKHTKKGFWFCTIATAHEGNKMNSPEQIVAITKAVSRIKKSMV